MINKYVGAEFLEKTWKHDIFHLYLNGNYSGLLNPFLFFTGLTPQSMALYLSWMKSYTAKAEFFTNQKFTVYKPLLMSILIGVGTK